MVPVDTPARLDGHAAAACPKKLNGIATAGRGITYFWNACIRPTRVYMGAANENMREKRKIADRERQLRSKHIGIYVFTSGIGVTVVTGRRGRGI